MKKYSVVIAHQHATSFTLEEEFYEILLQLSKDENTPVSDLITRIDEQRTTKNLSSAIRLYILKKLKEKISAS